MIVFLDTNTLLDVLGRREPFYVASAQVWALAETRQIHGLVSAISFNNIYYIVRKLSGREKAREAMRALRGIFDVVPLDSSLLNQAIDGDWGDFEDAIQYFSARHTGAERFLTRDPGDFPRGPIPIMSPEEFLAAVRASRSSDKPS